MIDLIDNKKNILVWQDVASDVTDVTDVSNKADKIPVVVNKISENYPPKKNKYRINKKIPLI